MTKKGGKKSPNPISTVKTRTLQFLTRNEKKTFSPKQLSRKLKYQNKKGREKLSEALEQLVRSGEVDLMNNGLYRLAKGSGRRSDDRRDVSNKIGNLYHGTIDHVNFRFAFVICEDFEDDVKISSNHLNYALDGDKVSFSILPGRRKGNRAEGQVVEIIERKRDEFVGVIDIKENYAFVVPDNKKIHEDIFVPIAQVGDAKQGQKVIVKIVEWASKDKSAVGKVDKVLGDAGTHDVEMHAILLEYDLPYDFPENVISASESIAPGITKEEIKKRRDMRDTITFTIDPVDAKDFDDALSIKHVGKLGDQNLWEIGIHIADVSHYVEPGSTLDKEAIKRATSVYLVDRVVPMLPERLSNELCSLRPNEDKLTYSAVFEMTDDGVVKNQWFGRTVIHSDKRFSYEEAQGVMDAGEGPFYDDLMTLNSIAHKLRDKRFANGSIRFESTEVRFELDENGVPISLVTKERVDTHKLIEDFMLLANRRVAQFIHSKKPDPPELTFVYRIHDNPNPERLMNFANFASTFGHGIKIQDGNIAQELNKMVLDLEGKPESRVLCDLAIRAMAKAKYSTENIGHFGLAFPFYTHFTSPIRRYPDVMVHRLMEMYLSGEKSQNKNYYEDLCEHCSTREKLASDAERASIKYKQVEYMEKVIGQEFEGIVTGISDWGIYVEVNETRCEGMVRLSSLEDDHYIADLDNYRIIGQNNKKIIRFGDTVTVRVDACSLANRTIDLSMVSTES